MLVVFVFNWYLCCFLINLCKELIFLWEDAFLVDFKFNSSFVIVITFLRSPCSVFSLFPIESLAEQLCVAFFLCEWFWSFFIDINISCASVTLAIIMRGASSVNPKGEIKVSFGYHCNGNSDNILSNGCDTLHSPKLPRNSSFSCLSGAALSANATLANTNICDGVIGVEILPSWDSPNSFWKVISSSTLSKLDILPSSLPSSMSYLSCIPSTPSSHEYDSYLKFMSAHSKNEVFLNAMEVQVAGGAADEDKVQVVSFEEDLFFMNYCHVILI